VLLAGRQALLDDELKRPADERIDVVSIVMPTMCTARSRVPSDGLRGS
jgi:hypothetical protein